MHTCTSMQYACDAHNPFSVSLVFHSLNMFPKTKQIHCFHKEKATICTYMSISLISLSLRTNEQCFFFHLCDMHYPRVIKTWLSIQGVYISEAWSFVSLGALYTLWKEVLWECFPARDVFPERLY